MRPLAFALFATLAVPALAQDTDTTDAAPRSVAEALADLRLATAVRLALVDDPRTRRFDIDVEARDGVVTVGGLDDPPYQIAAAETVRGVPGVRVVEGLGPFGRDDIALDGLPGEGPQFDDEGNPLPDRPAPRAVEIPEAPRVHVVRRGDTLYGIARRYGTTLDALVDLNRLRSTNIRVGQRIRLR